MITDWSQGVKSVSDKVYFNINPKTNESRVSGLEVYI